MDRSKCFTVERNLFGFDPVDTAGKIFPAAAGTVNMDILVCYVHYFDWSPAEGTLSAAGDKLCGGEKYVGHLVPPMVLGS